MDPKLPDPRNANIFVHVGGELLPRDQAKVSVFDSSIQGGDAVWEGLRVYISISEVYFADEMFCTGTVGELTPVLEVDGRVIGNGKPGHLTKRLREFYGKRTAAEGEPLTF